MSKEQPQESGEVLTREETRVKEPPMYKVILLNDDYTTMEFVVMILETVFLKSAADAQTIMLSVHEKGSGIAGIYSREIAETKVVTVHHYAKQNEYPLKCVMEPA